VTSLDCSHCGKHFQHRGNFLRHSRTHSKEKYLHCCLECDKTYSDRDSLKRHMRMKHILPESLKCEVCSEGFDNELTLHLHTKDHRCSSKLILSLQSDTDSQTVSARKSVKDTSSSLICLHCGKHFEHSGNFLRHCKTHSDVEVKHSCAKCDRSYSDKDSLKRHMKIKHILPKKFKYGLRSEVIDIKRELNDHTMGSSTSNFDTDSEIVSVVQDFELPPRKKNHTCMICGQIFKWTRKLRIHMEENHPTPKTDKSYSKVPTIFRNNGEIVVGENQNIVGKLYSICKSKSNVPVDKLNSTDIDPEVNDINDTEGFINKECDDSEKSILTWDNSHSENLNEFKCNVCGKHCSCVTTMKRHKKLHHKPTRHSKSKSGRDIEVKVKARSTELSKPYVCQICNKEFARMRSVKLHMIEHSSVNCFDCPDCEGQFDSVSAFRSHRVLHRNAIQCVHCSKYFSRTYITQHMLQEHSGQTCEERPYVCCDCGISYTQKYFLTRHIRARACVNNAMCSVCGKMMPNQRSLKLHMKCHNSEKRFKCPMCEKAFKYAESIPGHVRIVHKKMRPFLCHTCGKRFTASVSLKYHQRVHTGIYPPRSFACTICEWKFEKKHKLEYHMKIHGGERERRFSCAECGKSFTFSSTLAAHVKSHSNERTFLCVICNARFKGNEGLQRHMKIHSAEPSHVCIVCGKGFNQLGNMKTHMRTHSGERPYKCSVCNQSFPHQGSWKKHFEAHKK